MMIAVDRYILIVKPLSRRMSPSAAIGAVIAVALLATGAALPIALHADVAVVDDVVLNIHRVYCTERWSSLLGRQLYVVLSLVGQFVVPLTVIAILYYRIFDGLRARAAAAAANCSSSKLHVVTPFPALFVFFFDVGFDLLLRFWSIFRVCGLLWISYGYLSRFAIYAHGYFVF